MVHWQLQINIPQANTESLSLWLEEYALAVTISDAGNEPLYQEQPTETPLWQTVKIEALFAAEDDIDQISALIQQQFPDIMALSTSQVPEQDWVRLTQSQFPPQHFGKKLCIIPSWQEPAATDDAIVVRLDPGLAFGTGTHATTALCLQWLAAQDLTGQTIIDYGCGSGILALAALALGAAQVWAVDHDPQALQATANNASLNNFRQPHQLYIVEPVALPAEPVPLLIANILAKPLCELAPLFSSLVSSSGQLVLSGLLLPEIDWVLNAYQPHFMLLEKFSRDEWACLILKKNCNYSASKRDKNFT